MPNNLLLCKQTLSYKSSISNLKTHLRRKHPTIKISNENQTDQVQSQIPNPLTNRSHSTVDAEEKELPDESTKTQAMDPLEPSTSKFLSAKPKLHQTSIHVQKKIGFSQKTVIDEKVLQLVTQDFQPFSIVEDKAFKNYSEALNPSYTLPSRKMLSNTLLPGKFEEIKEKKNLLQNVKSVTITTDCWTSCNNDGFIAVTSHFIDDNFEAKTALLEVGPCYERHTSKNLANELTRITTEWGVQNKVLLAISDNAANIKKAILEELRWNHLGCIAHSINLIVQDALKPAENIVTKVSDIVSHFKRSVVAKTKLDFYQQQNGKHPKKIKQSVVTRWNSVYYMLTRIKELQEEVRASLAALGKEDWPMLTNLEFECVEELIQILAPIEQLTMSMSSENQVTLSSVIMIANGLHELYKEMVKNTYSQLAGEVINKIINGIDKRFKNMESNSSLLLSTFLDPRFKNVGFWSQTSDERAKALAINALAVLIEEKDSKTENTISETSQEQIKDQKISIWSSFDKKASNFGPSGSKKSRATIEIQRYLEEPLLSRSENPLHWWKIHAYNFPNLSELVKLKFGTVSTSVPCERMFSKSGQIISDR